MHSWRESHALASPEPLPSLGAWAQLPPTLQRVAEPEGAEPWGSRAWQPQERNCRPPPICLSGLREGVVPKEAFTPIPSSSKGPSEVGAPVSPCTQGNPEAVNSRRLGPKDQLQAVISAKGLTSAYTTSQALCKALGSFQNSLTDWEKAAGCLGDSARADRVCEP